MIEEQILQEQQPEPEPKNKASKLYKTLLSDGYTTKNLGSEQEFSKALSDSATADKIYSNLLSDGYNEKNLGRRDDFIKLFSVKVAQPTGISAPASEPIKETITTVEEDNDPISLATNINKLSKEGEFLGAAGTGGGGGSFVQSKSAAEKTVANKERLKQLGYKDSDIAKINEEWSDFPEEALNLEINNKKPYSKAVLSEQRKNDYAGYIDKMNSIKTYFNIRKNKGDSFANEFARWLFVKPTGNFYNDLVQYQSNKKTQEDIINSSLEGEDRDKALNRLNQNAESWADRSIKNSDDAKQAIQAKLENKYGITVDVAALDAPELKEYLDLNNPVEKVIYNKYKNGFDVKKSLQGSANLDEAAMKFWALQDETLKGQMQMSGDLPNNTKGELVNAFLENDELKELAKSDPELAKMYQQTKFNLPANYPDYAKKKVGQAIGQELENSGATNWFANIPTQDEVDKVVDKLVAEGKLSERDKTTYQANIKDELGYLQSIKRGVGRIPFGAVVEKSPIPTSGFLENTLEGFNETMRGTARSVEDIVSLTNPALRKVFSDDKRMYNLMQENSALQHIVPKSKLHEISEGTGHLAGFMIPMLVGGSVLNSAKAGHLINNALMFEGVNRDKALMEFPNDPTKRYLYTALATAGDVMLGELIPTKKINKGISNTFKSDIKGIVAKLADKSISSGEAKEALLKRAAELFPELVMENAKTAGVMTGFGAFHNALDSIFGANDMDLQDIAQEAVKSYKATFLTTPLLAAFAVYGKNKKVGGKILLEIADNPELYKKQIEEAALTDKSIAENKEEALKNLDALVSVSGSLEGTNLTEPQKEKYIVNAMAEKVWERKALNTSEENIASDYRKKAQEFRDKKEAIYKGKDKAEDYEKYDTNNPQEVFSNEQPTQESSTPIQPNIEEAQRQGTETALQPSLEPMGERGTEATTPVQLEAPILKGEPEQISQPIELSLEPQKPNEQTKLKPTLITSIKIDGNDTDVKLLEEYKGQKIVEIEGDVYAYNPKTEVLFKVALDDSKTKGNREVVSEVNNLESAKKYIDWATETRKENDLSKPIDITPKTNESSNPALTDVESTAKALEEKMPFERKRQEAINLLQTEKVNYRDIKGVGDLSQYLNNPEALKSGHLKSAYKIYEQLKKGEKIKDKPYISEDNELMDGQNRIAAQLALGIENLDVVKVGKSFFDKSPTEQISEAYHKAKADGSNPELVKAVEEILGEKTNEEAKVSITAEGESKPKEIANITIGEAKETEGKGKEGKIVLNKDNKGEFITKSKRQKVIFDKGDLKVVDAKTGIEVSGKTKKKALQEYAEEFDFSVGKEVTDFPEEVKTTEDAKGYIIENSENPLQLAEVYVGEEPTQNGISDIERMIADFGVGKVKGKSYNSFGDRNKMTLGKAKHYISKDGRSIDVVAAEMSDHYGVEITPQDVVDFIDTFPNGEQEALRMVENATARQAADKFKQLTGLTLNQEVAKKAIEKEFNKLTKEQQSLAEQDYENAKQLEEAYWEQFAKTDGFTKEIPNSETKQTETKGSGEKPPIEPPTEAPKGIPKESKGTQLSFKGLQEVADDFGLDPIRSRDRKTDTQLMKESEETIKNWVDKGNYEKNVTKIIKRADEGYAINDVERVILEQHIANLRAELSSISDVTSKEYAEGLRYLQEVVKAGNKARSAAGAALRIPNFESVPKYDLPSMMVRKMEALNVEELTDAQKVEIKSQYEEIEKRAKVAEEKVAELEKKIAEQNAKMALETKHTPKKGVKSSKPKTKEEYKAERKSYLEELKAAKEEHLKWLKDNGISNASILPNGGIVLTNKMAGIILKIVKSHVEEIGNDLKEITVKTFEDVKDLFEGITEQDIHDVIAGVYSKKEKTLSELQRDMKDLRDEAKLINELKTLMSGDESKMSENKKRERNQKIKDLKDKIKAFKDESGLTEKQKIAAAEKRAEENIKELERQIDENDFAVKQAEKLNSPTLEVLRKKQSELRKEIDELRKEAKEGKYSDLYKLEQVKKANEKAEAKIREKIANKEFETEEKKPTIMQRHEVATKFPKEYKEAMDAIIAKEDAQHEYEMALVKDEMAKRTKFKKYIVDPAKMIINTVSALKSGIDNSFVFVQGGLASLANPVAATKAMSRQITDFFSEKEFDRSLAALHNNKELWSLIERSGLDILDPKSLREGKRDEVLGKKNLLNTQFKVGNKSITIGKYVTAPFERLYTSMGNNLRLNIFLNKVEQMQAEGKTIDNSLKEYQDVARVINEMTGRGKLHKKLESGTEALSTVIWSPKLLASTVNLLGLGDVGNFVAGGNKGYYRGLSSPKFDIKNIKKSTKDWANSPQGFAVKQTASGFGMGFAIMALWALNPDKEVDTDPTSVTFGTVKDKVSGNSYNIFGRFTSLARLLAMLITNKKTIQGEEIALNEKKGGKTTGEETWRFIRGKFNPVAGEVADAFIIKKTFDGKPYTVDGFGQRMLVPMSAIEVANALEQQGWAGIFKRGIPSFYGIKVSNEADFKKDDLPTSKEETLKEKGIYVPKVGDKTQYKVDINDEHPDGVMTNEEFVTFTELLKSKFDENVNEILSANFEIEVQDPEENILVEKTVIGKDLPKENLQDRINGAKKKAVEDALKEMNLVKPKNKTTIQKEE